MNIGWIVILLYIVIAGLVALSLMRPILVRWYDSSTWFIFGKGPVDILIRQIGFRIGFEFFILAVSFILGPIGLWVIVVANMKEKGMAVVVASLLGTLALSSFIFGRVLVPKLLTQLSAPTGSQESTSFSGSNSKYSGAPPSIISNLYVTGNGVRIHNEPNINGYVLGIANKGDEVGVVGYDPTGQWAEVVIPRTDQTGWMARQFLTNTATPCVPNARWKLSQPGISTILLYVQHDQVAVRETPGNDGTILIQLSRGYPVQVLETEGEWTKVRVKGTQMNGWILSSQLGVGKP